MGHASGFTLVEALAATAVAAVLASLAYPSYQATVLKLRRVEALQGLAALQAAQEVHRGRHRRYATLVELGLGPGSAGARYRLDEAAPGAQGYRVTAVAVGAQAADQACRHLRLEVRDGLALWSSGPSDAADNGDAANRRCWGW
ncbi:type IV pilin protein [Piscinibacter sakaiensis]|uniref:Type IV pilus biogenesis protein PilE n=1 Tax=Piscinibacter sakaiensis TaxID=1547922 RepID=A0A0K8P2I7_PISS1|nr:type IV pilin protein [Piscinibacter sakaiensis]GAP36887.1 type IV pilus biogenesis protein PilE [Piscinibacter sakaiensis]